MEYEKNIVKNEDGDIAGYDFISNEHFPENSNDGDGIDPDPTDPGDNRRGGPGREDNLQMV